VASVKLALGDPGASNDSLMKDALKATFYASEIATCNAALANLGGKLWGVEADIVSLNGAALAGTVDAAGFQVRQASQNLSDAAWKYMEGLRTAGRAYDQRDLSQKDAGMVAAPMPGVGDNDTISMEAVCAMNGAMQARGAARESFGTVVKYSDTLPRANAILEAVLTGGVLRSTGGVFGGDVESMPIDHPALQNTYTVENWERLEADAKKLRGTVGSVEEAKNIIQTEGGSRKSLEARWQQVIAQNLLNQVL
jgi:hypothetical protein